MNITSGSAEDDLAQSLTLRASLQHLRFKNVDGGFHGLGRREQIGQKHLAAAELVASERDPRGKPLVHRLQRIDADDQAWIVLRPDVEKP